jgi:flagellin-like protein
MYLIGGKMFFKNKKGISPLIATVLVIGFTIVLAALVITWGTKLFKDTVAQTATQASVSSLCSTGLNLEATSKAVTSGTVELTMRNKNPDRKIDAFKFIANDALGGYAVTTILPVSLTLDSLVPKKYTLTIPTGASGMVDAAQATKIEVYPIFTIDGVDKTCDTPVVVIIPKV